MNELCFYFLLFFFFFEGVAACMPMHLWLVAWPSGTCASGGGEARVYIIIRIKKTRIWSRYHAHTSHMGSDLQKGPGLLHTVCSKPGPFCRSLPICKHAIHANRGADVKKSNAFYERVHWIFTSSRSPPPFPRGVFVLKLFAIAKPWEAKKMMRSILPDGASIWAPLYVCPQLHRPSLHIMHIQHALVRKK